MPVPQNDARIRLLATAYVEYYHQDLSKAKQFYLDFGMDIVKDLGNEIYFGGYGSEPFIYVARQASDETKFGGAAYEVESRAELEKAAEFPFATPIRQSSAPGGGEYVTLTDPFGNEIYLVSGQTKKEPQHLHLEKLTVNYEDEKPRKGRFQRFEHGPALVHRWGHYGVTYPPGAYQEMFDFYTQHLTLAPSDVVYKDDKPVTCFFHIDRGLDFTDHHAFFFKMAKPGEKTTVAHAAFEVHDFDTQQLGHQYLKSRGHELCWGVGRVSENIFSFSVARYVFMELSNFDSNGHRSMFLAVRSSTIGLTPAVSSSLVDLFSL